MDKYVITWRDEEGGEIYYFENSENSPTVYLMESTTELGKAKVFEKKIHAEVERKYVIQFGEKAYATTIIVQDKEIFDARLKGI